MLLSENVELFLNFVWISTCLALIGWWLSSPDRRRRVDGRAVVAVVLLVVLIFPVISMTDDLLAMSAPSEVEHVLRRYDAPLNHLAYPGIISALALIFVPSVSFALKPEPVHPSPVMAEVQTVCVRVTGVRPPPPALS